MHITWPPTLDSVKVPAFKGTVAAILIGCRTSSSFHKYVCSVTPLFLTAIGNGLTSPHPHFDTRSIGDEWCRLREAGQNPEASGSGGVGGTDFGVGFAQAAGEHQREIAQNPHANPWMFTFQKLKVSFRQHDAIDLGVCQHRGRAR